MERQETSKKRLELRWDNAVPVSEETLDFDTALKEIRGSDPRPMLVLRDCDSCNGRDDALLSQTLENDKTLLYAHWFHCIKVDRRVTEDSHPYHALFSGERPPHLFLASWEGTIVVPLDGSQSQKLLWSSLERVLRADYKKDPAAAVREWLRVLDAYDTLDSRQKELKRQLDEQRIKGKDRRVARLEKQIGDLEKDREETQAKERVVVDLVLKHAPEAKSVADFDSEAAAEVKAGSGGGLLDRIRKKQQ